MGVIITERFIIFISSGQKKSNLSFTERPFQKYGPTFDAIRDFDQMFALVDLIPLAIYKVADTSKSRHFIKMVPFILTKNRAAQCLPRWYTRFVPLESIYLLILVTGT